MMRLKSDIVPALIACADGGLRHFDLRWSTTRRSP
jgi:phosphoribosylamine--glycine ligase